MLTKRYKGDLKGDVDAGLEMSDYDVISLHIPYGPGWDARRIEKLVYQTVRFIRLHSILLSKLSISGSWHELCVILLLTFPSR